MADRNASPVSFTSIHSSITRIEKGPAFRDSSTASPPTSTPPTSLGDEASILSDVAKMEHTVELIEEVSTPLALTTAPVAPQSAPDAANSGSKRPTRSSRKSVTTYNVQILAGTAIHTPTKYLEKHHKNVLHGSMDAVAKAGPTSVPKKRTYRLKPEPSDISDAAEQQLAAETEQAAQRRTSSRTSVTDVRRETLRNFSGVGDAVANTFLGGKALVKSVLKRSASDSRLRSATQTAQSALVKRRRTTHGADTEDEDEDEDEEDDEEEEGEEEKEKKVYLKPKTKQWMQQGLFVGQDRDFDARLTENQNRARRKSRKTKENKVLPLPMFAADRMLNEDPRLLNRAFKLPFDVYHPLPRKVKVDGWIKLQKSKSSSMVPRFFLIRNRPLYRRCFCFVET
jgi:palmitoyltransferase ZDHHC9/14/18